MHLKYYLFILLNLISGNILAKETISQYCNNCYDCSNATEVCVYNKCECKPNYRYNNQTNNCINYACTSNIECQHYDKHRVCVNSRCECQINYSEDTDTLLCKINLNAKSLLWLWILHAIVAFIAIILLIGIYIHYLINRERGSEGDSEYAGDSDDSENSELSEMYPLLKGDQK